MSGDESVMKDLVGKTIRCVYVSDGEHFMLFDTSEGPIVYQAVGECCSESWFSDMYNGNALIGATVRSVEEIPMDPPDDDRSRCECDTAYGYKILTDNGEATIAFRNSSNGYYGGSIESTELEYVPEMDRESMRPIFGDWSA